MELGDLVQVIGALGCFDLLANLVDLLTDLARGFYSSSFGLPAGMKCIPFGFQVGQLFFENLQPLLGSRILLLFEGFAFDFKLENSALQIFQFFWHRLNFGAEFRGGFIDKIDCLVGKKTIGDVPVGEGGCCYQGGILNPNPMVNLIPLPKAAEDRDGILDGRFFHHDGLESTFEGCILFDIFSVFVQSCGPDAVEFTPGEHGFKHVSGVHRAFGFASSHDGVDLVDEEDDSSLGFDHFIEDCLEAFFEFPTKLSSCDKRSKVEGDNFLFL